VSGTINVLKASHRTKTVKRVILTSSVAAVIGDQSRLDVDHVFTEKDWNDFATIQNGAYPLSKVLAERAAWDLIPSLAPMELVVINPSFVLGPPLSARIDATSVKMIKAMLEGGNKKGAHSRFMPVVDVRDVSKAHILAMETEGANGRYLVASTAQYGLLDWALYVEKHFPGEFKNLPTKALDPSKHAVANYVDHSKANRELGLEFIPCEVSVVDMVRALKEFKILDASKL